jgi:hypothetical protein
MIFPGGFTKNNRKLSFRESLGRHERCAKEKSSAVYKVQLHIEEDFSSYLVRNDRSYKVINH